MENCKPRFKQQELGLLREDVAIEMIPYFTIYIYAVHNSHVNNWRKQKTFPGEARSEYICNGI